MQIRLQHANALHCFCNRDSGLTGRCIRLAKFLQGNVALQRRRYHTFVVAEIHQLKLGILQFLPGLQDLLLKEIHLSRRPPHL